jgi:hypothetical protein
LFGLRLHTGSEARVHEGGTSGGSGGAGGVGVAAWCFGFPIAGRWPHPKLLKTRTPTRRNQCWTTVSWVLLKLRNRVYSRVVRVFTKARVEWWPL